MENRLARSPVNYPLVTTIAASALTMLVVISSLLIAPWQKCTSSSQTNSECLHSELILLLSPTQIQVSAPPPIMISRAPPPSSPLNIQTAIIKTEESLLLGTKTNISPKPHVPQFPDFILPRPEPEGEEASPAVQVASKEQTTPDFVAFQMLDIRADNALPPLPRAPNMTPSQAAKLEGAQLLRFSSNKIIIQDGDNLWSISSRIYGAGRQYIQIFEANKNLISSPHRIFPGQVLALPKEAPQNHSATE